MTYVANIMFAPFAALVNWDDNAENGVHAPFAVGSLVQNLSMQLYVSKQSFIGAGHFWCILTNSLNRVYIVSADWH